MDKRKYLLIIGFLWLSCASFSQTNGLDYYINHALGNSPLLKDYINQAQSILVDSQLIRATYKPQVTGTNNNYYAPVIGGVGYDGAITNGGNVTALLGVNKTFVSHKNLNSQFETIRLQSEGIQNSAKISEQDLKKTITDQYITAYGGLQQLNFSKEIYALLKKEEAILKKLTEANVYRQTDYLTFLVTFQQQELASEQLAIQYQNDYSTLNYIAGIEDTSVANLPDPGITLNYVPLSENSVFLKQYTLDSLKSVNQRLVINFNYKPKLDVFADAGYNSTLVHQPYKNFGTSVGASLIVPIYDGRQKKLQYNKLAIAERTRLGYKAFFKHQYNQQIAQLSKQLQATDALIVQINNQIKYSEGLIKVNVRLLETGDAKIADLVIAFNNYLSAKNLLTQNTVSRWQIINQINYWNR